MVETKKSLAASAAVNLARLREKKPLVHNITNYVVMNFTANCLLSLGASPVMAHAESEIGDISSISSALVLNIGTLSPAWIESMVKAAGKARAINKPFVLDPVGAGASVYRTETARRLLEEKPSVVRGNASEIMALAGGEAKTKGVDSLEKSEAAVKCAEIIAEKTGGIVVVSGEKDFICSALKRTEVLNGVEMMGRITGMGCVATSVIGAFLAVVDPFDAAVSGMAVMGICGETAFEKASSPGSFMAAFLDSLYEITPEEIGKRIKIIEHENR